jgi:hypothetical protein
MRDVPSDKQGRGFTATGFARFVGRVKNCPHGAINLNLRVPGSEIWEIGSQRGTAFLVIGMIGGLFSEMVSKMPFYGSISCLAAISYPRFTVVFIAVLVAMNVMLVLAAQVSSRIYGERFRENYSRHGLALLPLALTAFMAFHIYYLVNLGVQLPTLLSHNFDFAVFRGLIVTVPPEVTRFIQQTLIYVGLAWSLILYRLGRSAEGKSSNCRRIATHAASSVPGCAAAGGHTLILLWRRSVDPMSLRTTGPEDSDLSFPSGFSRLIEKLLTCFCCCAVLLTAKAAQFMLA